MCFNMLKLLPPISISLNYASSHYKNKVEAEVMDLRPIGC